MSNPLNTHGIDEAFDDVRAWHIAFDNPAPALPVMQTPEQVARRAKWMRSEIDELERARTTVDQADAYLDIIFFAIGGLVEMGVKMGALWREVFRANMAKLWPDGKPRRREDGKTIKPPGWTGPEWAMDRIIFEQMSFGFDAIAAAKPAEDECTYSDAFNNACDCPKHRPRAA